MPTPLLAVVVLMSVAMLAFVAGVKEVRSVLLDIRRRIDARREMRRSSQIAVVAREAAAEASAAAMAYRREIDSVLGTGTGN